MVRLFLISIFISISFAVFSQDQKLVKETVDYIIQTYHIPEGNPIYYEESGSIDSVFKIMLLDYFKIKKSKTNYTTDYLFNLLYSNSISEYEDSPDMRRMKMRRSLCFSCIAFKADLLSASTFIDYAKYSILYQCPDKVDSDLEQEYCGMLFLELLLNSKKQNYYITNDLNRIKLFLSKNQSSINSQWLAKSKHLIGEFEKLKK